MPAEPPLADQPPEPPLPDEPLEPRPPEPPLWYELVARDTFARLLDRRIVFLRGPILEGKAGELAAQLIHLDAESTDPVTLYIDSPAGDAPAPPAAPGQPDDGLPGKENPFEMFALHDTIQLLRAPVHTVCLGIAASAGAFLLATGTGTRSAGPNARIMIHQPLGEGRGAASDIEILVREFETLRERMEHILAECTGQPVERLRADMQRDFWMSAVEAREYGLIDEIAGS